jgi:hypothetical protein
MDPTDSRKRLRLHMAVRLLVRGSDVRGRIAIRRIGGKRTFSRCTGSRQPLTKVTKFTKDTKKCLKTEAGAPAFVFFVFIVFSKPSARAA